MHVDNFSAPRMFHALFQWAVNLREVGDLPSACSAAEALCREAQSADELRQAYRLLAGLRRASGDLPGARPALEFLVDLARRMASVDPVLNNQLDLLAALDELGDLARQQGDDWTVLECHGNHGRAAILRELERHYPGQANLLTELCYSLRRAGNAARALGSHEEARNLLEERLTVARVNCAANPGDDRLVSMVAAALADLGGLLAALRVPRAESLLREELGLRTWLESVRPGDAKARQDLATCHVAMTTVGVDTAEHKAMATHLLAQIEQEGGLDLSGHHLLSTLRAG